MFKNEVVVFCILMTLWLAKTQQCFTRLAEVHRHTETALKWIRQYKDYATGAVTSLNMALITAKESLSKERARIMDAVVSGQIQSTGDSSNNGDLPPLFSIQPPTDVPPPVYEAPPPAIDDQNLNTLELPSIPSGVSSPATSFIDLPSQVGPSSNTPSINSGHEEAYTSHNVNNPFLNK